MPKKVAIFANDEQKDSMVGLEIKHTQTGNSIPVAYAEGFSFGLGFSAGGAKLGAYNITLGYGVKTDSNEKLYWMAKDKGSDKWGHGYGSLLSNGSGKGHDRVLYTLGLGSGWEPFPVSTATIPLIIDAALQPTNKLNLTDETLLDGQATISLQYL
ncbi:MAG: hypothetical protein ACRC5A_04580 [Enterobacteriaceae bacterium]